MKRVLSLILSLPLIFLCFTACGGTNDASGANGTETTTVPAIDPNQPLCDGTTLKVLAIGNSFSNNTTNYLYEVAKAEGATDVVIGRLYLSGCTLEKHLENAQGNKPAYRYDKNNSGQWTEMASSTLLYALQDEQWDIIIFQQGSGTSGKAETYAASIDALVKYVDENKTNPNARFGWHMTWAYQQGSTNDAFERYDHDQMIMYNAIVGAVQQVIVPMEEFHSIIPVGTAVQNIRTSFIGDNVTRDTYHLNAFGDVLGAYTWYSVFTGKPLETINLSTYGDNQTLTDQEKAAMIEAINAAIESPFAVTESTVK